MKTNLDKFSSFHNRYYKANYGKESSAWLLTQVQDIITKAGATNVNASAFKHSWVQSSIVVRIPGKSANTVVVGAHQDSINLDNPTAGRAPGADDNGSGSMTILEAFRVLLTDPTIKDGGAENSLEFHWYAGEEAGMLGSQAIFKQYASSGVNVRAMLNQDMTGYVKPGSKERFGMMTDNTDKNLNAFTQKVITTVCYFLSFWSLFSGL